MKVNKKTFIFQTSDNNRVAVDAPSFDEAFKHALMRLTIGLFITGVKWSKGGV